MLLQLERVRQKLSDGRSSHTRIFAGRRVDHVDHDVLVATAELPDDLSATATGTAATLQSDGKVVELLDTLADHRGDGVAFGAAAQRVGGVLDVDADMNVAVSPTDGATDRELRIRRVRLAPHVQCPDTALTNIRLQTADSHLGGHQSSGKRWDSK